MAQQQNVIPSVVVALLLLQTFRQRAVVDCRVCAGEDKKLSHSSQLEPGFRYNLFKKTYANCTIIRNNVEIVGLDGSYDLSFLDSIEEVNGAVLFALNHEMTAFSMKNLKIIRGHNFMEKAALYIAYNQNLQKISFPNLREIQRQGVVIKENNKLCFANTINWNDFFAINTKRTISITDIDARSCSACSSCESCWDENTCQTLHKVVCDPECATGCVPNKPSQCCSKDCAAGCIGQFDRCEKCRFYNNSGTCVVKCPPHYEYNQHTMKYERTDNGKYAYLFECVEECPGLTVRHNEDCLNTCPEHFYSDLNNTCVPCMDRCPKVCKMEYGKNIEKYSEEELRNFEGCNIVDGHLMLSWKTFEKINSRLNKLFGEITEVTGNVWIQGSKTRKNLNFLKNLRVIRGQAYNEAGYRGFGLIVSDMKALTEVNLPNLERIENSGLRINLNPELVRISMMKLKLIRSDPGRDVLVLKNNPKLCYASKELFAGIIDDNPGYTYDIKNNSENCVMKCHEECDGLCWAENDPNYCKACKHFNHGGKCVNSCSDLSNLFIDGRNCIDCDAQCTGGCKGEGPTMCNSCLNAKNDSTCVEFCPSNSYKNETTKLCQPCAETCKDGCSGPGPSYGKGGCNNCYLYFENNKTCVLLSEDGNVQCDDGFFNKLIQVQFTNNSGNLTKKSMMTCAKCDDKCLVCTGESTKSYTGHNNGQCECKYAEYEGMCVDKCPPASYSDREKVCRSCHNQCIDCFGSDSNQCITCKNSRYYPDLDDKTEMRGSDEEDVEKWNPGVDDSRRSRRNAVGTTEESRGNATDSHRLYETAKFLCVDNCPDQAPYSNDVILDDGVRHKICEKDNPFEASLAGIGNQTNVIAGSVVGVVVLLVVVLAIITLLVRRQKVRLERNKMKLQAEIEGLSAGEVLALTKVQPDLSVLKLIEESELKRGPEIGSGAFGTVYKGIWSPVGKHIKVAVAIKVLNEGSSTSLQNELLDEARVMSSVTHPCCIKILAVCMARTMMLITPLVNNGSLLEYIRKNKADSSTLLKWATQIARGMNYLEQKGIVHRDLAARNILVHNKSQVKITDFGLAKLLNCEEYYLATGGKMPIKWIALESIEHRVFTHKSDVWSYGVTLWELFTSGDRPYDNISAIDMAQYLENGNRLSQPPICTIDVYMLMVKCWLVHAESRPSFAELETEFSIMSRDPGRYLVIEGDRLLRLASTASNDNHTDFLNEMQLSGLEAENIISGDDYWDGEMRNCSFEGSVRNFRSSKKNEGHLTSLEEESGPSNDYVNKPGSPKDADYLTPDKTKATKNDYTNDPSWMTSSMQQQKKKMEDSDFCNLEAALNRNKNSKDNVRYLSNPSESDQDFGNYIDGFCLGQAPRPPSLDEKDLARLEHSESVDLKSHVQDYIEPNSKTPANNCYLETKGKQVFAGNPEYFQGGAAIDEPADNESIVDDLINQNLMQLQKQKSVPQKPQRLINKLLKGEHTYYNTADNNNNSTSNKIVASDNQTSVTTQSYTKLKN